MDIEIRRRLDNLIEAVASSEEFRVFEEAKRRLDSEPEKRRMADDFRRRNFEFQNSEESMSAQAQVAMYHERESLRRDSLIDEYLKAELVMCRLLRQISLKIVWRTCSPEQLQSRIAAALRGWRFAPGAARQEGRRRS